jgi:hypothetical protein
MANISPFKEAVVSVAARHYGHEGSETEATVNPAKIEAVQRQSSDGSRSLVNVALVNTVYILVPEVGHKKVAIFRELQGEPAQSRLLAAGQACNLAVLERSVFEQDPEEVAQATEIGGLRQIHDILGHARVVQVLDELPEYPLHAIPIEGESAVFFPNA